MVVSRKWTVVRWLAPLAVVALALGGWFAVTAFLQGPLSGEMRHDFGAVAIPGSGAAILPHEFRLKNDRDGVITIRHARPDCGCLTVDATFPMTVEPGKTIALPITLTYTGTAGPKTVLIRLDCGDAGIQHLRITARPAS